MKARVKNVSAGNIIGNTMFVSPMDSYIGKVIDVYPIENRKDVYTGPESWAWRKEWLEFIPEVAPVETRNSAFSLMGFDFPKGIVNYWGGGDTIFVTIRIRRIRNEAPVYNCVFSGHAICNESDEFSLAEGIKVACFNALQFDKFNVPQGKESKRVAKDRKAELQHRREIYSSIRNTLRGGLA